MPKYRKKPHVNIKVGAQVAGERLESIRKGNKGRLTPAMVVDDARPKMSPLHNAFEWDDTKAAAGFRLVQAGDLIRCIIVVTDEAPDAPPVRAFVNIETDDRHYTSIQHAMSDKDLRLQVVNRAMSELTQWETRYRDLKELAVVFAAIKKVRRQKKRGKAA